MLYIQHQASAGNPVPKAKYYRSSRFFLIILPFFINLQTEITADRQKQQVCLFAFTGLYIQSGKKNAIGKIEIQKKNHIYSEDA